MSASNAQPQDCVGSAPLARAIKLLEEALALIDEHASRPEFGARLQEIIDGLKSKTG